MSASHKVLVKKRCLFFSIITSIALCVLITVTGVLLIQTLENDWVMATCHVQNVEWQDNLYNTPNFTFDSDRSSVKALMSHSVPLHVASKNNRNELNGSDIGDDIRNPNIYSLLKVNGWVYDVNVLYDNLLFKGQIRDPSATELIPALYEKDYIGDCLCMMERVLPETIIQDESYEKYKSWASSHPSSEGEGGGGGGGGNIDNTTTEYYEHPIYFITAVTWPTLDTFMESHQRANNIKIVLVVTSSLGLVACVIFLKVFYNLYVSSAGRHAQARKNNAYKQVDRF